MRAVARVVVLVAFFGAMLLTACATRHQHVVERPLRSAGGLECPGYLVWNREAVRDVFLVISGSGHLSNAFVHPSFEEILGTHQVAYATYDKPGIHHSIFERYTLGHRACLDSPNRRPVDARPRPPSCRQRPVSARRSESRLWSSEARLAGWIA
jgi:hypothetical protein